MARYLDDGSLDPSFGDSGLVRTTLSVNRKPPVQSLGAHHGGYAHAVEIMSDGRIVVAGNTVVARHLSDGTPDPTLGGGTIHTLLPNVIIPAYEDVVVAPDGGLITVGGLFKQPDGFAVSTVLAAYAPCGCAACEACDGLAGCVAAPLSGCFRGDKTTLHMKKSTNAAKDSVSWRLSRGDVMFPASLGFPSEATEYAFCVYDESGVQPVVAVQAALPTSTRCANEHCWRTSSNEAVAKYRNRDELAGATGTVTLKPVEEVYKSSVRVKLRGAGLSMPSLTLAGPVRAQLQAENGGCWDMIYDADDVVNSGARSFKAKTDFLDN